MYSIPNFYCHSLDPDASKQQDLIQVVPVEGERKNTYYDSVVPDKRDATPYLQLSYLPTGSNLESYLYLASETMQQISHQAPELSSSSIDSSPRHKHEHSKAQRNACLNTPSSAKQMKKHRRNSSGCEARARRHSTAAIRNSSLPCTVRPRRRSHDVRDEQVDILDRLRIAATTIFASTD